MALLIFALGLKGREPRMSDVASFSCQFWLAPEDLQRSSLNLRAKDDSYAPFVESRTTVSQQFAYLWISIRNDSDSQQSIVFTNTSYNYTTEMLRPDKLGATTMFRQGDTVPISTLPIRHYRVAFPVAVPPRSTVDLVVEYYGPRGIVVDPVILTPAEFFSKGVRDRATLGTVYGAISALLLLNLFAWLLEKQLSFISFSFFIICITFFSLRQNRILLLLIDPLAYPEWLFPVSIGLNIVGGMVFAWDILREHLTKLQRYLILGVGASAVGLSILSIFTAPYPIADTLNLLTLAALPALIIGAIRGIRSGDTVISWFLISLIPWFSMMVLDILSGFLNIRISEDALYRQLFGLAATLLLVTIALLHNRKESRMWNYMRPDPPELRSVLSETENQLTSLERLRKSLFLQLSHQVQQPLDGIIASATILGKSFADPGVAAASQIIIDETLELKHLMQKELGGSVSRADILQAQDEASEEEWAPVKSMKDAIFVDSGSYASIWIFEGNEQSAARKSLKLKADGYATVVTDDQYRVLEAAAQGELDVLIVDPLTLQDSVFRLCEIIRGSYNLFELPILMVTEYHAQYLMKKGYAVGINDFLTVPFEPAELTARVQSLAKLRQIAKHNSTLAQSEKEKNAFLYFLTHNINSPLTLILNRVRDLEAMDGLEELPDIVDDLQDATQEINEIVHNILISFRLADGRQPLRLQSLDLHDVCQSIDRDLRKKANIKRQTLSIDIPTVCPMVEGDYIAIRGILYNLVDNAIKFSPKGGSISVTTKTTDPLRVEVRDSGPGIPAEDRNRMFGRFERLSPRPTGGEPSTGLGLYVARELARLNGGGLGYAEVGEGACFVLTLPVYRKEAPNGNPR